MRTARILLADDHAAVRDVAKDLLEPAFQVVGAVADGTALVEAALRLQPDMIVTDISMPNLNGIKAAQKLKQAGLPAKVIFLTTHPDSDFVQLCFDAGASGYVTKLRMDTDLVPAVHEALAGRSFLSPSSDETLEPNFERLQ